MPTFGNPLALFGLVLGSAPIIIHLLNRRRFRVVEWAAMEFLLASNRRNYRRIRLEQLILLALRVLLIVLLILLVSRPIVQRRAVAGLAERERFVLLLFDNSLSMGYRDGSASSYDAGLRFAEQLMGSLRQGDTWALVTAAGRGRAVLREPSYELDASRAAVAPDRLPLTDAGGSIPGALAAAEDMLEMARGVEKVVYIVTDMQQASWTGAPGSVAGEDVERLKRISKSASVVLVDVGAEAPSNLAVTALETEQPLVVTGAETVVRARVSNFGSEMATGVTVAFLVDGFRQQTSPPQDIGPGGSGQREFRHVFRTPGAHVVTVELDADNLAKDNRRLLAIDVRESVPILCVDGEPGGESFAGEVDFLRQALRPGAAGGPERLSLFEPEVVTLEGLAAAELPRYDAVVLANVPKLERPLVESLERYVEEGGTLAVFLGDQVDGGFYNEVLYRDGEGLLPCSLGEVLGDPDDPAKAVHLSREVSDHPFVEFFRERKGIQLSSAVFYRYFRLENAEGRERTRVVCRFDGGAPAVVEAEQGKGRVVVSASTADDEWNDLTAWPAYLTLVQEVFRQAARDPGVGRNVTVGEPLVRYLPPRCFGKTVSLLRPGENRPVSVAAESSRGLVAAIYERTDRAGIYELTLDGEEAGPESPLARRQDFFAVNVPARESDLRRIGVDALRRLYPGAEFAYQRGGQRQMQAGAPGERGQLWRSLAYALLALLLVESVLAQRFGR